MSVFGKKRVETLEVFSIEVSFVFVKNTEFEMDVLSVELASVLESTVEVLVGTVIRLELCIVIKSASSGMAVSCSIELGDKDF